MAWSKKVLLLAAVAAVASLASLASATEWLVGDERGWRSKFNETGWADDKTFVVGDTLRFVYNKERHTVVKVRRHAFEVCDASVNQQLKNWTSGNDVVPLHKPGKVFFICSKPNSCLHGMKLAIEVLDPSVFAPSPLPFPLPGPAPAPAPAPSPPVFRWPLPSGSAPAPSPPASSPPSAAVRSPVGGAVAVAAAAVVAAALAF